MKNQSSSINLPEKVFFQASQITNQQKLEYFTYCYKKYNDFRVAQTYGQGFQESDSNREEKKKLIINCVNKCARTLEVVLSTDAFLNTYRQIQKTAE